MGTRPKPLLQVVREGNPGKRPLREGVQLPPAELEEPDWLDTFPNGAGDESRRARLVASREWQRVVPVLEHTAGLAAVDVNLLHDYCVCVARIDQCERALSRDGLLMQGERGWQKHGATTIVGQYRTQLRAYIGELGLSPSARTGLKPPKGPANDDADPFD
ncbi:MAG: phage terminase small subunit P27 family [Aeromicrobium sp.]